MITSKIEVILVDENDNQLGTIEKMEAHEKALLHRAVSVFIVNTRGEWLLQQRALSKYHSRGLWSNTCCTHPYPNESVETAARRRLREEMGIDCALLKVYEFTYKIDLEDHLTEYEYDHVFIGITDEEPNINRSEVESWKYISKVDLSADLDKNPDNYSYWFRKIFPEVKDKL